MHCHIYGIGLESTFNMHSDMDQSFLKVQCHLLSGKKEMQVRLSLTDLFVCVRVCKRESKAACLVYQLCRSRSNTSCHSRVALHWPLVHRQKLTSTWRGEGMRWQGKKKGVSVVKSRRRNKFLMICFQKYLLLFLWCLASLFPRLHTITILLSEDI